jgi:predicted metal-binding protein
VTEEIYNPLEGTSITKTQLAESAEKALLKKDAKPLVDLKKFDGAGVYVLYYVGSFSAYKPIAIKNKDNKFERPIYIGKAIPAGGRKGASDLVTKQGDALYRRLKEHSNSVSYAKNLKLEDFFCRYLVMEEVWISLVETLLITIWKPIWNTVVEGFGNHVPGKGRYQGARPIWDELHPGRGWAAKCQPSNRTPEDIIKLIAAALVTPNTVSEPKET